MSASSRWIGPALLAALAAVVWVHHMHLDPPLEPASGTGDLIDYFHPAAVFIHDQLQKGQLPLWNPYQLAGQPFLALHITGALYPANLLLMGFFEAPLALELHAVLHIWLAGLFTWLFARRLGLRPAACASAALIYMLSGSLWIGVYMTPYLSTPTWLPAILWALHGLLTDARGRWALALAATLSMAFLGGFAQGFVYIAQTATIYGLFGLMFVSPRERRLSAAAWAAAAGVLAFTWVAPQLLPSVELTRDAVRSFGGLPQKDLWLPYFTRPHVLGGLTRWLDWRLPDQNLGGVFRLSLPLLTLPLVALGGLARGQRSHWVYFLAAAIFGALFIMGPAGGVFRWYTELPPGDLFRGPGRAAFLYVFHVAMLVGIGVHGLALALERASAPSRAVSATLAAVLVAIGIDGYRRAVLPARLPDHDTDLGSPDTLTAELEALAGYERVFFQTYFKRTPGLRYKAGMMNGLFVVPDYEPSMPGSYSRYLHADPPSIWHGALTLDERGRIGTPLADPKLLDLMSVRYYATYPSISKPGYRALLERVGSSKVHTVDEIHLLERSRALPRAYVVPRVLPVADAEAALSRLRGQEFSPQREAIVVADASEVAALTSAHATRRTREAGHASIEDYSEQEVTIAASCQSDCLMVLTDLDYPGWRAYVDGREATILNTNSLYRGVALSAGTHQVVFRLESAAFRTGLTLFAIGSAGAVGASLLVWRRGRHRS